MDRLLQELTTRGVLDPTETDWARTHQNKRQVSLDTALLELDLVDEPGLLRALKERYGKPAATPADFAKVDANIGQRLPESFAKSFLMCPLRLVDEQLIALVQSPLPPEWVQELRELFGLEVRELVAPEHYLLLAAEKAWGKPVPDNHLRLEARLARRRGAPPVAAVAEAMAGTDSFAGSISELLDFASCLVDYCCFFVPAERELRVLTTRSRTHKSLRSIGLPEPGCTLHPAISHGGYFVGSPTSTPQDRSFFEQLERPIPHRAFIAPVPIGRGETMLLYADNGPRGIAPRWIAELSVLVGRLGQKGHDRSASVANAQKEKDTAHANETLSSETPSSEDSQALARLRSAAAQAGMDLLPFVDELLSARGAPRDASQESTAALVGEVKGLFEKLATDIPTHLARGMEAAFRDLAPRMSAPTPGAAPATGRSPAKVELVQKEAAPREVESYASKRRKTRRVKL